VPIYVVSVFIMSAIDLVLTFYHTVNKSLEMFLILERISREVLHSDGIDQKSSSKFCPV
jgi:hypothetical protein